MFEWLTNCKDQYHHKSTLRVRLNRSYRGICTLLMICCSVTCIYAQSINDMGSDAFATLFYGKDYCSSIDSSINVASDFKDNSEQYELFAIKSFCFQPRNNLDSILLYLEKSRPGESPRVLGLQKSIQGYIEEENGKSEEALSHYTAALNLYDPRRDALFIANTNLAISWMLYGTMVYEPSIKYALDGLDQAKNIDYKFGIVEALDILSNVYGRLQQIEKSDSCFAEYIEVAEQIDHPVLNYWVACAKGNSYGYNGDHNSAYVHFERALEASHTIGDSSLQSEALLYIGECANRIRAYDRSVSYLTQLEQYPPKYRRPAINRRLYEYLSSSRAAQGDYNQAYQLLSKYKEIDEEYLTETTHKKTLEFEAKYQSLQKDKEISDQRLKVSKSIAQRNLLLAGAIGLGFLIWFLIYRNRKNKSLATTKIQNLEKQQKLMALDYMVQGQEEERKRIAQDLHDGLGGILASARIQMQKVQTEIEKLGQMKLLDKAEALIDNAHTEVRRISHDMMPGALIDLGLIDAIDDLTVHLESDHGLTVNIIDNTIDLRLNDLQRVQLYRCISEMINNTVKHAKASKVDISFSQKVNQLEIHVSDDGSGFDYIAAKSSGGMGIQNITSRVHYLNGTLTVESKPDNGTSYKIMIPL